jgi:inosine/xanthosine triphosphatase
MKIIAVGSKNPVKINAIKNIAAQIWPEAEIYSASVSSEVSEQPMTDEETILGSKNRAKNILKETKADLAFGLEGGVDDTEHGMFVTTWVSVIDRDGNIGLGLGGKMLLPEKVAVEIRNGGELGPVLAKMLDYADISKKEGAVGVFTNNLVSRTDWLQTGASYALAKILHKNHYL